MACGKRSSARVHEATEAVPVDAQPPAPSVESLLQQRLPQVPGARVFRLTEKRSYWCEHAAQLKDDRGQTTLDHVVFCDI